jgi:hypothetical protein
LIRSLRIAALLATTAFVFAAGAAQANDTGPRPMFAVIPHLKTNLKSAATSSFPATWNYTYSSGGASYTEAWIGANPSSATSQTVPVYIIPLKLVWTPTGGTATTEDATPIVPNIIASPIFTPMDFKFGKTDIGTTQYEDAFAKANVWSIGGSATGYHVLLGKPTVTKTQTITVPAKQGSTLSAFGITALIANINWFDPHMQLLIKKLKIPANALPIFVTTQTYLTGGAPVANNCCIGGYHSVDPAGQPYSHFTFIQQSGAFSQDVSALSHELGEWIDDPYTNNNSPCGIYEVGDPLERDANYGDYPYTLNGVTYHLQDLALLPYFGGPKGVTLANLDTLQGTKLAACANGS